MGPTRWRRRRHPRRCPGRRSRPCYLRRATRRPGQPSRDDLAPAGLVSRRNVQGERRDSHFAAHVGRVGGRADDGVRPFEVVMPREARGPSPPGPMTASTQYIHLPGDRHGPHWLMRWPVVRLREERLDCRDHFIEVLGGGPPRGQVVHLGIPPAYTSCAVPNASPRSTGSRSTSPQSAQECCRSATSGHVAD